MDKNKNARIRHGGDIPLAERHKIIREYLAGGYTKRELWYKYTGKYDEHGSILRWMRMYGYVDEDFKRRSIFSGGSINYSPMEDTEDLDKSELLAKIKQLEKQLQDAKLREEGYRSMIDLAEQTFKIPIRKKSDTR